MNKIKIIISFGLLLGLLLMSTFALGNGEHNHESEIEKGKQLVESSVSCDKLNDEQLEDMGEYYMEQMHPGKAHEIMDQMMGGEDSESLKQMHIQMAKRLYCNEDVSGMMGSGGMMGGGMMNMMMGNNMMGSGGMMNMMGGNMVGYQYGMGFFGWVIWLLVVVALILLIVWLIKQIQKKK